MTEPAAVHDTIVVERNYPVSPDRVFAAWADVAQRKKWHVPGDDAWVLESMTQDFRVGGLERAQFGPAEAPNLMQEGRYLDIVPDARIVSAGTMHLDGVRVSMTLCTVELADDGDGGTHVKLTDQSVFLDGREMPGERQNGWGKVFERLRLFLAAS